MKRILLLSALFVCLIWGGIKIGFYAYDKSNHCYFYSCGFEFTGKYKYLNENMKSNPDGMKKANKSLQKCGGKFIGSYKHVFGYGDDGKLEILVYQHNDSLFPSTARGKDFLDGFKHGDGIKSATMISDIAEYDDSLVLKFVTPISRNTDVPYQYWVKPYKERVIFRAYDDWGDFVGYRWRYVERGGYYETRYKTVTKDYPSSSSVIYKNGIAYIITIVSFTDKFTSAELYDMVIPCLKLVNVKMRQLQLYALAVLVLLIAFVVMYIMYRYIKTYIKKQDMKGTDITYSVAIAKIVWPYLITGISAFTVVNMIQSYLLEPYKYGYIIMYIILLFYYLKIIIKKKDFGIKQILFYELLTWIGLIKKEWSEITIRKTIVFIGTIPFALFYIVPCFISWYYNNIDQKAQHNIMNTCDTLSFVCLALFYIILICMATKAWIYSPQNSRIENGENK